MNIDEITDELSAYYSRMNHVVIAQVGKILRRIKPEEYGRIYEDIINRVPASHVVGVSDVFETCNALGIKLAAGHASEKKTYPVTCDCCGYEYRWGQFATDSDAIDHVFDACPRCKFPYYETWTFDRYAMIGRRKMWEPVYERMKEKYLAAWKAGPLVSHI